MARTRLPVGAGLGLKTAHVADALASTGQGLWFEVHTENYMIEGGPRLRQLSQIRERFELSLHGVGGSLGGLDAPGPEHLQAVGRLVRRFEPAQVSEHAVWSSHRGSYFADLLPLPRTRDAMRQLINGIDRYQNAIGRPILIENPTNYLPLQGEMDEAQFLNEVAESAGCGLLLDISNVHLSANNCGIDARAYIGRLPGERIEEIHIAGFDEDPQHRQRLLIDSHASPVDDDVWRLLDFTLDLLGPRPVLLERDGNVPPYAVLLEERDRAATAIERARELRYSA